MSLFRWSLFVAAGLGLFVALLIATADPSAPQRSPAPPSLAPAATPIQQEDPDDIAPDPVVGVCELLVLAAQADPAFQFAAGRPAADIVAVAALQRDLLLAAAELLGPGPAAEALAELADVFVGDPGRWSEKQWSDALVARADPARLAVLEGLESRC